MFFCVFSKMLGVKNCLSNMNINYSNQINATFSLIGKQFGPDSYFEVGNIVRSSKTRSCLNVVRPLKSLRCLLWHNGIEQWFSNLVGRDPQNKVKKNLVNHIKTVIHFLASKSHAQVFKKLSLKLETFRPWRIAYQILAYL